MNNTKGDKKITESIQIKEKVNGVEGFTTGLKFTDEELAEVRNVIRANFLARIKEMAPEHAQKFSDIDLDHYHELAHLIKHDCPWPKEVRLFSEEEVEKIKNTSVFKRLKEEFGCFTLCDRCPQYGPHRREEMYWRIVRPNASLDVGPLHADRWFWDVGTAATLPPGKECVKVWISVYCESGKAGLRVVPGSHKKKWKYHAVEKHGAVKPQIDEDEKNLSVKIVPVDPGEAIVFHNDLLHGGFKGTGQLTRVSMEFTIFVEKY